MNKILEERVADYMEQKLSEIKGAGVILSPYEMGRRDGQLTIMRDFAKIFKEETMLRAKEV